MDAPCKIQGSIHVFRLVNNMCPGKWVHIMIRETSLLLSYFNVSGTLPLSHAGFLIFVNTHDIYQ